MLLTRSLSRDFGLSKNKDLGSLLCETAVKPTALSGADSSGVPGRHGKWQIGWLVWFCRGRLDGWWVSWLWGSGYRCLVSCLPGGWRAGRLDWGRILEWPMALLGVLLRGVGRKEVSDQGL